jgi:hypothetical protein
LSKVSAASLSAAESSAPPRRRLRGREIVLDPLPLLAFVFERVFDGASDDPLDVEVES